VRNVVFHADMDAFYASVEQLDDPSLRGKPVIVGAAPGRRGVVSACSYEARAFGVRSAMPIARAYRLCPGGVFRPVRMERYRIVSRAVMDVFASFTPDVRPISVDEAFLDMTGTERLFGPPAEAAARLKQRVRDEIGLAVSVGVGTNRYIAKLASASSKPDGLLEVPPGDEEAFMERLPLTSLWGIGDKTRNRLLALGVDSVRKIRDLPAASLERAMGAACGAFLFKAVRGLDPGIFSDQPKSRSMSSETTFEHDVEDEETLEGVLLALSQELAFRLLEEKASSRTVHVKIRYDDFETVSAQETLPRAVETSDDIREAAWNLFRRKRDPSRAVRLIGLGLANLDEGEGIGQGELFASASEKKAKVERAALDLRKSKGAVLTKARLVSAPPKERR